MVVQRCFTVLFTRHRPGLLHDHICLSTDCLDPLTMNIYCIERITPVLTVVYLTIPHIFCFGSVLQYHQYTSSAIANGDYFRGSDLGFLCSEVQLPV